MLIMIMNSLSMNHTHYMLVFEFGHLNVDLNLDT